MSTSLLRESTKWNFGFEICQGLYIGIRLHPAGLGFEFYLEFKTEKQKWIGFLSGNVPVGEPLPHGPVFFLSLHNHGIGNIADTN